MIEIVNIHSAYPPGAFSHIYTALDWIHNSLYTNEKIFINWKNGYNENLWDVFFTQPIFSFDCNRHLLVKNPRNKTDAFENINNVIPIYNKFNGYFANNIKVLQDDQFYFLRNEYNKAWTSITIKENIKNYVKNFTQSFENLKVLGAAVRCPIHYYLDHMDSGVYLHNKINPSEFYQKIISEIEIEFVKNKYDKIFVCCDIQPFIDLMIHKFGQDIVLYTKYNRIKDLNQDWIYKNTLSNLEEEYKTVIADSLILSNCQYLMGSSSNIFLITLCINNTVNFKIFDVLNNCYGL